MKKSTLLLLSLAVITSAHAFAHTKAIYGDDNRVEVYASPSASFRELAKSTAAMFENKALKRPLFAKYFKIKGPTLTDRGMCSSERFSSQLAAASCSGFLVSPTTLVTAGHCIKDLDDCANNKWVFDYRLESANQTEFKIPQNSVYNCKRIINRKLTKTNDFAYIELDRAVTDRQPLKVRQEGKAAVGDELVIIGHPSGLPTKIADGAKVRAVKDEFFVANLDSYGGNSGSAVFNVTTEEIEGILVRGEKDYEPKPGANCGRSVLCQDDSCRGEDVTYITNVGIKQ